MSPSRPNILCIVSEDCPPWLGAYGDPIASTPNLDRLAREGVTWQVANSTAPVCAPSRFAILTGRHAPSVPPAQHMTSFGPLPAGIPTYPEVFRAAGYYCTNNFKTHYNCDVDPKTLWNESSETAHWRNRPTNSPFLAVFNTMVTHESCTYAPKPGATEASAVRVPSYLPDTEAVRASLVRYYNQIAVMDAFMGDRLAELEQAGLAEDTIVFYYSDHASPLPRSKRFVYDNGLNVPMIVRVPERWRHLLPAEPGSVVDTAPVSLVDLFPTQLAVANIVAPDGLQGQPFLGPQAQPRAFAFGARDRMDERYDFTRTARSPRYRYIRNYAPHRIWGQHYAFAWQGGHYQDYEQAHIDGTLNPVQDRFWQRKPAEELYDMHADRDSVVNLVGSPDHQQVLDAHRSALDEHLLTIRDCGFVPEGADLERPELNALESHYPLATVMALASKAIARQPENIDLFVATLTDPHMVIRYWATQGLLMLAVEGQPLPEAVGGAMTNEVEPTVWIALAEAMGHAGQSAAQARALVRFIGETTNPRLQLQALNSLTELQYDPAIALDLAASLVEDGDEYVRGAASYLKLKLDGSYTPSSQIFRQDLFKPIGHA